MTALPDDFDYWLLDLDGTLVDVEWQYTREVFDDVGDRLGRSFSDYEAEVLWHGLGGSRDATLRSWGIDPEPFWEVFDDVEDPQKRAEETYLYEDAAFIADLDAPTALVTHCADHLTQPVLDSVGIRDWFDGVVCCDYDVGYKPDPAPVQLAMKRAGIDPRGDGRGVLAGDGASDIEAAANAGIESIHVERHDPERRDRCVLGDYRIGSFEELWTEQASADD